MSVFKRYFVLSKGILPLCVLHVFQKKSKRGAKTPARDFALIRSRLQLAERLGHLLMFEALPHRRDAVRLVRVARRTGRGRGARRFSAYLFVIGRVSA
jgi:hypothetical protein